MQDRKKLALRILLSVLGTAAIILIAVTSCYMLWEKAPDLEPVAPETVEIKADVKEQEEDNGIPFDTARQDGVYTLLLVGNDDGNGNTDTILVGKVDTEQHKMDFFSIPRDTLINVDWSVRKLNSVYWGSKNSGGSGIDALNAHIKKLIGFDVDCYAIIDLGVFVDVVDAMGGVDFDVPVPMHYEDIGQNLYINLEPGMQHLDGYQAMGLCRFRSGYSDGDYGRIQMQQQFLKSCAEQFISLGNIPNISKVVKILAEGMDTNLSGANIGFFLRQALKCEPENINFYTVPSNPDYVGGLSYSVIDIWQWLPMLNQHLNPYETEVEYGNLDVVYKENGSFTATTYLQGAWYYEAQPAPVSKPQPEAETEAEPELPAEPEGPTIIVIPAESPAPEIDAPEQTVPESGNEPEIAPEPSEPENSDSGTEADNIFV